MSYDVEHTPEIHCPIWQLAHAVMCTWVHEMWLLWLKNWGFYLILIALDLNTEKAMAPHSSTLAWKIPWMEEPGRIQSMGSRRVRHDWTTSLLLFLSCIGEGNVNPLQCSFLENPRDGGAWWAAVNGCSTLSNRVGHDWSDLVVVVVVVVVVEDFYVLEAGAMS